jgi:hypothetical protein
MCGNRKTTGDYGKPFKLKFSEIREPHGRKFILGSDKGYDIV